VIGYVDDELRSLLKITIRAKPSGKSTRVTVWVDTAFNGYLVFSKQLIAELALQKEAETEAIFWRTAVLSCSTRMLDTSSGVERISVRR
jgi:predicted aspartyl protease